MGKFNQYFFIEFNGLPGSGKSTICNELVKELEKRGALVLTESDIFISSNPLKKIIDLINGLISFKYMKLNINLIKVGMRASIKRRCLNNIKNSIKIIRYNHILSQRVVRNSFDYICLSEGFVQFIYSIFDGVDFIDRNQCEILFNEIRKLYKNILIINCNITPEVSLERVEKRTSQSNTIDLMNITDRIRFFEIRYSNMNRIKTMINNMFNSLEIDTSISKGENVCKLLLKIGFNNSQENR